MLQYSICLNYCYIYDRKSYPVILTETTYIKPGLRMQKGEISGVVFPIARINTVSVCTRELVREMREFIRYTNF